MSMASLNPGARGRRTGRSLAGRQRRPQIGRGDHALHHPKAGDSLMNSHSVEVAFFASLAWIAWAAAYAWSRWLIRPQREPDVHALAGAYRLEERLASIEQSMQAMAIEIERLGEG